MINELTVKPTSGTIGFGSLVLLLSVILGGSTAIAQTTQNQASISSPDRKHIFQEDSKTLKRQKKKAIALASKTDKAAPDDIDVKAGKAEFLKESNEVKGTDGVVIARQGIQIQSNDALVNMTSKDATLSGKVVLNDNRGTLTANSGKINLDSERGVFADANFSIEDGAYDIDAAQVEKLSDTEYQLQDSTMSTCQCTEKDKPWTLHSSRAHITQEGYAHTYNTWMDFHGMPLFYTPYLAFPVKSERASGLLAGNYGYSRKDGVSVKLPVFLVLDESSDVTVAPFLESKTRYGSVFDYRQAFSRYNKMRAKLLYSNDSMRDDDLRGTITSDVFNPQFKENRAGLNYSQQWTSSPEDKNTWAFIADVHYVNDNLFLREFDDDSIGLYNARYTTSTLVGRASLGDYVSAQVSGEYNQSIDTDPDLTFQRLPEANVSFLRSFRPFGANDYGLKLVTQGTVDATNFSRSTGYDGWRTDAMPRVGLPFHVKNYVNGQFDFAFDQTNYELDSTAIPGSPTNQQLDSSQERHLYAFGYRMGTGVERVYQLDKGNWLSWLTSLGQDNQANKLMRLKHNVEPFVNYSYVPDVTQDDLPVFDSFDRVRARSLVLYGFRTNLLGRFLPERPGEDAIPELTPRIENLPLLGSNQPLSDLDTLQDADVFGAGNVAIRTGEVRQLVSLGMKQSYDFEQRTDKNPDDQIPAQALSDLNSDLTLYPSKNFALRFEDNYSTLRQEFSSWGLSAHFLDDRGDVFRARYTFVENDLALGRTGVSQLEGNAEVAVTDQFKLGYYARYDNREKDFLERRFGMRLYSACDCWHIDLGVSDKINPDRQYFNISFTFTGLGDVGQRVGYGKNS